MAKLYSYNGYNRQIIQESENIYELLEKGIGFNAFICSLEQITNRTEWMEYLKRKPSQRYYVELESGCNYCYPDILGE